MHDASCCQLASDFRLMLFPFLLPTMANVDEVQEIGDEVDDGAPKVTPCCMISGGDLDTKKNLMEIEASIDGVDFVALRGNDIVRDVSHREYYPKGDQPKRILPQSLVFF